MQDHELLKELAYTQNPKMCHMINNSISRRAAKSISNGCEMEQVGIPIYLYEIVYK